MQMHMHVQTHTHVHLDMHMHMQPYPVWARISTSPNSCGREENKLIDALEERRPILHCSSTSQSISQSIGAFEKRRPIVSETMP